MNKSKGDRELLNDYISQVPSKIPPNTIKDEKGRKWIERKEIKQNEYTSWDYIDEDAWYVWFYKNEPPDIDEIIYLNNQKKIVDSVFRVYKNKRALVIFDTI